MKIKIFIVVILTFFSFCRKSEESFIDITDIVGYLFMSQKTSEASSSGEYKWNLPPGWPVPVVPSDNQMTKNKVRLGRFLFYDKRLSKNQTQACASCHIQSLAFSDGRTTGLGSTGENHPRNPQQLNSPAYNTRQTWANNQIRTLEEQAFHPMFGNNPVELGLTNPNSGIPEFITRLTDAVDIDYRTLFRNAFGDSDENPINDLNVRRALASFQRTLISGNSYYDQFVQTHNTAVLTNAGLNASYVVAGAGIFNDETGDCFHCHGGFNYTDTSLHTGSVSDELFYHSNGIYSDLDYSIMKPDQKGLYSITGKTSDVGFFRAPSLRNVAVTHPYMHDGSFKCSEFTQPAAVNDASYTVPSYSTACVREALMLVVNHYNSGGKSNSNKDASMIRPLGLTTTEKYQLVEFLMSLTDQEFLTNPEFSNPEYGNANFANHP